MDGTCYCGWLGIGTPSHPIQSFHPTDKRVTEDDMAVKTCMNCNGEGKIWNSKTQKNDITCPACDGKGRIVVGNV